MTQFAYQREFIADTNGKALDGGKLYIGTAGMDPETHPIACYWDAALTIPATQPIAITTGYVTNAGARVPLYFSDTTYSMRIRNRLDALVDYIASASGAVSQEALDADVAALEAEITALDTRVTALEDGPTCYIIPVDGQSLTIGRANQVTTQSAVVEQVYMPVGGSEWPSVNSPAPLSSSSRPISPANFASFSPLVQPSGKENLFPGLGYQVAQTGADKILVFAPGEGGTSIGQHLAGGGAEGGATGPYFANLQAFLRHAVAWAREQGLVPIIIPILNQGHSDADQLNDGGLATTETTQAEYLAALTKYKRDINMACSMAMGTIWNETLWITPLLTGAGTISYTLAGRKQVVAAQLQASQGSVPGVRLLPPFSQFTPLFETDLIHPGGQAFRYYGEVAGLAIFNPAITVPYITAVSVLNGTQVKVTFDQAIAIDTTLIEATTAGVQAGLEAYTAGGAQLPLTAATASGRDVTVTMASTATFSKIRNGLAQETIGAATKTPRTRIRGTSQLGTAQDGTALWSFSTPQEF
jgi:hypothetical protein